MDRDEHKVTNAVLKSALPWFTNLFYNGADQQRVYRNLAVHRIQGALAHSISDSLSILSTPTTMPSSAINELRRRVALDPRGTRPSVSVEKQPVGRGEKYDDDKVSHNKFRFTDLLRVLAGLALLSCVLSYFIVGDSFTWGYRPWWTRPRQVRNWMVSTISSQGTIQR